jgi:hypothetical protein
MRAGGDEKSRPLSTFPEVRFSVVPCKSLQISQRKCLNDLICHLSHRRAFLCFQSAILQRLTQLLFGLGSFGVVIGCIELAIFAAIRTIRLLSSSSASSPPSFPQNVLPPATSAQQFRHPLTSVNPPGFAMRFSDFQPVRQSCCAPTSYPGSEKSRGEKRPWSMQVT